MASLCAAVNKKILFFCIYPLTLIKVKINNYYYYLKPYALNKYMDYYTGLCYGDDS